MTVRGRLLSLGLVLVAVGWSAWLCAALWFQLDPPWRWTAIAVAAGIGLAVLALSRTRRFAAAALLATYVAATAIWWASITPSNDRDWAPDVAHGVTGTIDGASVVLQNVRDFDWRSESEATERWESRRYSLDDLRTVDLLTSVWSNPAIAHTLVSFGFADGRHVVFSAEIRRERHEDFSALGGFFKRFELVLIAAEERDIVRLRTNLRREDVSLFPLRIRPERARALFRSYVERANALAARPEFYQTITTNCTTVVFQLARAAGGRAPLDWRILLSGHLAEYLYDHGAILSDRPIAQIRQEARISAIAQREKPEDDFSRLIRSGGLFTAAGARAP